MKTRCKVLWLGVWLIGMATASQAQVVTRHYRHEPAVATALPANATGVELTLDVAQEGEVAGVGWGYVVHDIQNLTLELSSPAGQKIVQEFGKPWVSTEIFKGKPATGKWKLKLVNGNKTPGVLRWWQLDVVTRRPFDARLPATGWAVAELAPVDAVMLGFLREAQFEAATIAVMRNGRLVLRRGYGWQDRERTKPILPDAIMRIASNTKPITAAAVRNLIRNGRITPETKVLSLLQIEPPLDQKIADARWSAITIQQLLDHTSGLRHDRPGSGQVGKLLGLKRAATTSEIISYMMTQPLEAAPGLRRSYSNFGYLLLGAVIEKVSGKSYEQFIRSTIAMPLYATSIDVALSDLAQAGPQEIWYAEEQEAPTEWDESLIRAQPYSVDMRASPAAGSLVSTAVDVCKFMRAYLLDGHPKPASLRNVGWNYTHFGSLPGTLAIARQTIGDEQSLEYAVLINERRDAHPGDLEDLTKRLDAALSKISVWPEHNLFLRGER